MKNNLFANGLLVLIGILLLLAAMQMFGWGRGTKSLEAEAFDVSTLNKLEVDGTAETAALIDDKTIVQITDAPLFSVDRAPYVELEGEIDPDVDGPEVMPPEPLKAKVTSIIITDENSYAMVFDELSRERITLRRGMPLPGDQGLWVVDSIKPRAVTFVADGEEPVELELEVFSGQLNNKASRGSGNNKNRAQKITKKTDSNKQKDQKNSAEEIRRKIAERRAQMRANAAKGNKE